MGFTIEIDASTAAVAKNMSELKADLAAFKGQLEKATDTQTISRLNKAIKETDAALKGIKNFSGGQAFAGVAAGANQAGFALTNFGRIVQDAPFGFIAIQNNLDPLLGSFRQLIAETGSVKGAIKALGTQLTGAAGLGLALNLVTSAITIFAMATRKSGEEVESADKKFKEFAKTVKTVQDISDNAVGSNTGQIALIRALGNVVQDTNKAYDVRKRALEELKQINAAYFKDLTLEQNQMPKLTAAINEYTQALVAQAKVRGLTDEISRLNSEFIKQDRILSTYKTRLDQATKTLSNTQQYEVGAGGVERISRKYEQAKDAAFEANKAFLEQRTMVEQLGVSMALLNGDVANAVGQQLQYKDTTSATTKEVDALSKRIAALRDLQGTTGLDLAQKIELSRLEIQMLNRDAIKLNLNPQEVKEKTQFLINELFPAEFTNFFVRTKFFVEPEVSVVKPVSNIGVGLAGTNKFSTDIAKAIGLPDVITPPAITIAAPASVRVDPFAEAIGNAFADSLTLIGEKVGEAFATGDFMGALQSAAQGILSILGDTLISIGKQLIVTSQLVKGLKSALRGIFGPGGDAAALAVGVGLIAFGGLLKNIQFQGPKLADGGIISGSTLANIGEAGTEVVAPLTKLPYLMNQAIGGSSGGMVVGLRIKGRELLAMLEREKSFAKRLG